MLRADGVSCWCESDVVLLPQVGIVSVSCLPQG